MDFEKLIAKGENPLGMTAQVPPGTAHWEGTGWNDESLPPPAKQGPVHGAFQGDRSNRTGE
jgi:hypothetical protein